MRTTLTAIIALLLPSKLAIPLLNRLGHKIHCSASIGFSLLFCRRIFLGKDTRIGNFNLVRINKLLMREGAFIKSFNRMRGPINLLMQSEASISNSNSMYRAEVPVNYSLATLKLGELGQIVSKNHLDLTRNIEIGDNTTVGGLGSQFWTHGLFHDRTGRRQMRADGPIKIGNNVYAGSGCKFNPGIYIADGIFLGSSVCVSKSLETPGMYVSQPLRHIERKVGDIKKQLKRVPYPTANEVCEKIVA